MIKEILLKVLSAIFGEGLLWPITLNVIAGAVLQTFTNGRYLGVFMSRI